MGLFIIDEKGSVPISNGPYPISKKRKEGGYGKTQEDRTEERNRPQAKAPGRTSKTEGERAEIRLATVSILGLVIWKTMDDH